MQTMLAVAAAVGLIGGGALAVQTARAPATIQVADAGDQAELKPQRIVIGLDLSKSNPLIDNPAFARESGAPRRRRGARSRLRVRGACAHLRQFRSVVEHLRL